MKKIVLLIALLFTASVQISFGDVNSNINPKNIINSTGSTTKSITDVECLEARKLLDEGEYRKAYDLANKISVSEPTYYLPYQIKAIASANMYEYQNALENIDKAIKLHPEVTYPITLYGIRDGILYDIAYIDGEKPNFKYAQEFQKDFELITHKYIYQLYPSDVDYSENGDTLWNYIDYLVSHISKSESYALYKINTLLSMASSEEIDKCKYTNSYMYYYKLYALAIKIAFDVSNENFKQTQTSRKKVLSMIKRKMNLKGDKYFNDFTKYLYYQLSGETQEAETWMHSMVIKRDKKNAYPKGYLYEDDIDEILDYGKRYENLIWDTDIW